MTAPRSTPKPAPRSPEANVLVDGFETAIPRIPENPALILERQRDYFHTLCPRNYMQAWIADDVALMTIRLERAARVERRERDRIALRAEHFWDDDRRTEVEELAARLAADPARVVDRLRKTPHGCDWLIRRWALLAREIDRVGKWDDGQEALAFDLLGTPAKFRNDDLGREVDDDGRLSPHEPDLAAFARRQIAALRDRRAIVEPADTLDRALARADMSEQSTPELRRLRRYETSLHKRLRWDLHQLQVEPRHHSPNPSLAYLYEPEPKPEPTPVADHDDPDFAIVPEPRIKPEPKAIIVRDPRPVWVPTPLRMNVERLDPAHIKRDDDILDE